MATSEKYFEGIGRRKTSVARVRLISSLKNSFQINEKSLEEYFKTAELQKIASESLERNGSKNKFKVSVKIKGGGIHSQAEALRHGIARALINFEPDNRGNLKRAGFLKRDSRMKERRKFGLKKARKAPQWSKR